MHWRLIPWQCPAICDRHCSAASPSGSLGLGRRPQRTPAAAEGQAVIIWWCREVLQRELQVVGADTSATWFMDRAKHQRACAFGRTHCEVRQVRHVLLERAPLEGSHWRLARVLQRDLVHRHHKLVLKTDLRYSKMKISQRIVHQERSHRAMHVVASACRDQSAARLPLIALDGQLRRHRSDGCQTCKQRKSCCRARPPHGLRLYQHRARSTSSGK